MSAINFIQKNAWFFASMLYVVLIAFFSSTPVFWDMYAQVKTAHYFLETGFKHLLPNGNGYTDNGHFPLYIIYLAICFKVFGLKLWVAHVSVLPFILGLFYQLQRLCKRYLSAQKTLLVLLLAILNPALQMQSIYFNSEICLAFCCIWLLNALLNERASHIVLSSTLLCLFNLRAFPFVLLLWVYFFLFKKKKITWCLVISMVISIIWLITHFYLCGWALQNPENIQHRSVLNFSQMLKNTFWYSFHLLDYGSIIALIFMIKNMISQKKLNEPPMFILLFAASVFAFSVPISNPINTRYFLPIYILLVPTLMSVLNNKKVFILLLYLAFMWQTQVLKTSEKYGYSWDCNWQSLSYFDVRKQFDEYVSQNNISPKEIDAGYQLYFNDGFYLMNNSHKEYALLSDTEMPTNTYVAQSNIPNNYNPERENYLKENYSLIKSFSKGWVYIDLYKKQ